MSELSPTIVERARKNHGAILRAVATAGLGARMRKAREAA